MSGEGGNLRRRVRERLAAIKAEEVANPPLRPEPLYDDTFFAGTAMLEGRFEPLSEEQAAALDEAEAILRCIDAHMEERIEAAQKLCAAFGYPFELYTDDEEGEGEG